MNFSKTNSGYTLTHQVNSHNSHETNQIELSIKNFIIFFNFDSKGDVLARGSIEKKPDTRTYAQIFKDNLSSATYDQWQNTAGFLIFLITGSYGIYKITSFVRNFLKQRYEDMLEGRLYVKNDIGLTWPYGKFDFYKEYCSFWSLTIFLGWGGFAAICYELYVRSIFYIETKLFYIQHIVKGKSSMKSLSSLDNLGNQKDENGCVLDCITQESIPLDEIYAPKIILVDNLASHIENTLKIIFRHSLHNGAIKHPFYNYYMTSDNQEKLVKDITTFFCISKEDFMKCWDIDLEEIELPDDININKDDLFTLARLIRFLELLPNEIIKERLTFILLNDQRSLATYLSKNPLSLVYSIVIGLPSLAVTRFLNLTSRQ